MTASFRRGDEVGYSGQYLIDRKLGEGGFGETYKAVNTNTSADVALKFLDNDSFEDAKKEAGKAVGRHHEAVVDIIDVVAWERPFIVMEFVDGQDLSEYIRRNAPIAPSAWWQTLKPLLRGVHHLHTRGLVHRDIKPSNIILREARAQQPVIVDFGAAREQDRDMSRMILDVRYADPQITNIRARRPETSWDIYSLAVVSFEALFGKDEVDYLDEPVEAHEYMRQRLATSTPFCQTIAKGLETIDERPKHVIDWLLMMVQPDEGSDSFDSLESDDVPSASSRSEQLSTTTSTSERHTVAAKCREIEQTYNLPERSVQLFDANDEPLDGRTSLVSFWKSWEYIEEDREISRKLFVDEDNVRYVREGIEYRMSYPEKAVRLVRPNGEPYFGGTRVGTVRRDFAK